jgi:hypothetical protein
LYPNLRDLFKLFLSKYEQSRFSIKLFKLLWSLISFVLEIISAWHADTRQNSKW